MAREHLTKPKKPRTESRRVDVKRILSDGDEIDLIQGASAFLRDISQGEPHQVLSADAVVFRDALERFVATIDNTGGVVTDDHGYVCPKADPDWVDMGEAYLNACSVLQREPLDKSREDGEEDQGGM